MTLDGGGTTQLFTVEGSLTLDGLTLANGHSDSGSGGAVYINGGTLTVANSTLNGNSSGDGFNIGLGGAIHNDGGTLTVANSTFSGNSADEGGGIYNHLGTMTVSASTFGGNSAADGGAIASFDGSTLTVAHSTFGGNSAGSRGGAIANFNGSTLIAVNSTFSGNSSGAGGGGGAIYNSGSTLTIADSTFNGNSAHLDGGAITNASGSTLTVGNSTFTGNSASSVGGNLEGGGTLKNTIVANAAAGGNCANGSFSGTNNLEWGDTSCSASGSGWTSGDPKLGPLAPNGGPTDTMALGVGSAALGAGDPTVCASEPVYGFDQRGYARSAAAGFCDIGAYQSTPPPAADPRIPFYGFTATPIAADGSLETGDTVTATVYARTHDDKPAPYAPVYLSFEGTGTAVADGAALSATPQFFTTDANGEVQVTYTAGPPLVGGGTDTLTASGVTGGGLAPVTNTYTYPAPPVALAFASAPVSGPASATASLGPIRVALQGAGGGLAAAPPGGVTVTLTSSDATGGFAATPGGALQSTLAVTIPAGASVSEFYFGDPVPGTPTITASAPGLGSVSQPVTVTAAAPAEIHGFGTASPDVVAGETDTVRGAVYDAQGNPVAGAVVTLAAAFAGSGSPAGHIVPTVGTDADGGFQTLYTAPETAGTVTLTARAGSAVATATVEVTSGPPAAVSVGLEPAIVTPGSPVTVSGAVADGDGNPVAGAAVTLTATAPGFSGGAVAETVHADVYGHYDTVFTPAGPPGPVLLTASVPGFAPALAVLQVTAQAGAEVATGLATGPGGVVVTSAPGSMPQVAVSAAGGPGAVGLVRYTANPVSTPGPDGAAIYLDAGLSAGNGFTRVTIQICGLAGRPTAYWWDGTAWRPFSPQGMVGNCLNIGPLTSSGSSPTLAGLEGTPIAVASRLGGRGDDDDSDDGDGTPADGDFTLPMPPTGACPPPAGIPAGKVAASCVVTLAGAAPGTPQPATIRYDAAVLGSLPAGRLSIYHQNADGSWTFLPTAVDVAGGTVSAYISGPETLVVLADTRQFPDVPASHWAAGDIDVLLAASVVDGFPDGTFRPEAALTRAQFTKMLVVALGLPLGTGTAGFGDVPAGAWYAPYVAAGVETGIVAGTSPDRFDPDGTVTREQMAVFLARALRLTGTAGLTFSDAARIDPWARAGVEAAVAAGYLQGFPDGSFRPLEPTTRAQAARVLAMLIRQRAPSPEP